MAKKTGSGIPGSSLAGDTHSYNIKLRFHEAGNYPWVWVEREHFDIEATSLGEAFKLAVNHLEKEHDHDKEIDQVAFEAAEVCPA